MKQVLAQVVDWLSAGRDVALARVIAVQGSAPLDAGAAMAVAGGSEVSGTVSGGCVDGAVVEEALAVLAGGPARRLSYGFSDADALEVGLTCGGRITVLVHRPDRVAMTRLASLVSRGAPVALATEIDGPRLGWTLLVEPDLVHGTLGNPELDLAVAGEARSLLELGQTSLRRCGPSGEARRDEVEVSIQAFAAPPAMLIFGANDFARALSRHGRQLGYRVIVCDPRRAFARTSRFPDADEVIVEWPDDYLIRSRLDHRSAICVLTHDPKFDLPLLQAALGTPAGYIGAMGSRRTDAERTARLVAAGVDPTALRRIRGPIGLDIGARTPEEVAVSIACEIIAARSGRTGGALREASGPVRGSGEDVTAAARSAS